MDGSRVTKDRARALRSQMSLPEVILWKALRGAKLDGHRFRRQHPFRPYILDFYCDALQLAVEVDGGGHGFGNNPERDQRRDGWLAERGVRTLRISARLVLNDADDAVRTIQGFLQR